MTHLSDKIRTGDDWCASMCIVIECDDTLLFEEPRQLDKWLHGKAKGQIIFNLEEAKKLQADLANKIIQYESMTQAVTE